MKATHTPIRNVRVDDVLWSAARAAAGAEGQEISAVIRECLRRYVGDDPRSWPCTTCKAAPGERCRSVTARHPTNTPHAARREAAEETR